MKKTILLLTLLLITPVTTASTLDILSTDPAPVEPGDVIDVTVRISMESDRTISDATLRVLQTDLVKQIGTSESYTNIQQGDIITATIPIVISEDAPEGNIPVLLELRGDEDYTKTFNKRINVVNEIENPFLSVGSIKTTPQELLQDTEDNKLDITLNNLGDKDAQQVTVTMRDTEGIEPSYTYSLRDSLASINGNEGQTVSFTTDILEDAPQTIETVLDIQYKIVDDTSQNSIETEEIPITIPLAKGPYLTIENVEQRGSFAPGSTGNELRLTVVNNGEGDAEDARIRIFPDVSYPFIFDATTKYIASVLEPDQNTTVPISVEVTSDAEQRAFPTRTELESRVGSTRYDRSQQIEITVQGEQEGTFPTTYVVLGLIGITAVSIGIYRKKYLA